MSSKVALHWTPWLIAGVAMVITLRGLLAQAALQADLNAAMNGVLQNVKAAGRLTTETAQSLAPLAATASTLEIMNGRLRITVTDLKAMNQSLGRVIATQDSMLSGIASLNGHTGDVIAALGNIDGQNRDLLAGNAAMSAQAKGQANTLESLSVLTDEAVMHLRALNRKFAFLKR